MEMLDSLKEVEIEYSQLLEREFNRCENSIEVFYKKLEADLRPLMRKNSMFKLIVQCVENTHAAMHHEYKLHVEEVSYI